MTTEDGPSKSPEAIHLRIPPRYLVLPFAGAMTGLSIGLIRGARTTSWRFLAENAHRPPTTVQGWYFYKKTKNYKMILGGLKEGGTDALKLGIVGLGWAGLEDGLQRIGLDEVREIGAGLGTAGLFAGIYRLPRAAASRTLILGVMIGGTMRTLRWGQERLRENARARLEGAEIAETALREGGR